MRIIELFVLMVVTPKIIIERFGNHADERLADVISQEVTEVEDGGIILPAEPLFSNTLFNMTDIPVVSTGNFFSCSEVLPKSVFEEGLRQAYLN